MPVRLQSEAHCWESCGSDEARICHPLVPSSKRGEKPYVLLCCREERQDAFKELHNNGTLILFVGFCCEGVSLVPMHLCASVHSCVRLRVHAGSYFYHLFTFPCLYLVAVSHLSPPLFCPTSRSFWVCQMPHALLTQYLTFSAVISKFFSHFSQKKYEILCTNEEIHISISSFMLPPGSPNCSSASKTSLSAA